MGLKEQVEEIRRFEWHTNFDIDYPVDVNKNEPIKSKDTVETLFAYIDNLLAENKRKEKIECALGNQIDELSKAHTFCGRHNEDDIDFCPNCTIEEIDEENKRVVGMLVAWRECGVAPEIKAVLDAVEKIIQQKKRTPVKEWVENREELKSAFDIWQALKQGDSDEE